MKKLLTKRFLLISMVLATAFALLGCQDNSTTTTTATTTTTTIGEIPGPTNLNQLFFQGDGFAVTYGDFYEEFKVNDGLNQLLMMVDEILFDAYADAVTPEQIEKKIKYLTYGSLDDDEIAALDAEELADYVQTYQNNMFLMGYEGNEEAYVRMLCGKENFAKDAMVDLTYEAETWYVGEEEVAIYYRDYYYEDVTAIKIRCINEEDAKNVLQAFNLVSYQGQIRLYTGTIEIDKIPSFGFNDTNTRLLTDDELLSFFLQMYNYVYDDYRTTIDPLSTVEELQALDELRLSYVDTFAIQSDLANFVYDTLAAYDDETASKLAYTYVPASFPGASDTATYLILKISDPNGEKVDLTGFNAKTQDLLTLISQAEYDEIIELLVEKNQNTSGTISKIISAMRAEHEFEILDYFLGLDYQMMYSAYEPASAGSSTVVATFDDVTITADQLLIYAMERNATLYSMYAAQMQYGMSQYFPLVYCPNETVSCEFDLDVNHSEKIQDHLDTLAELKTQFEESYYSMYYDWNQWLYLAYGVPSEDDMILNYYVKSTLQPYIIYDGIRKNDWSLLSGYLFDLIEEYYDGYFDLFVETLTISVDRDEDGTADNYAEFAASQEDQLVYEAMVGRLDAAVRDYLDASETNTYASLVRAYNKALRTDLTWGEFKRFGFFLTAQDLSGTTSSTFISAKEAKWDEALIDGLIAVYGAYQLEVNEDAESLLASELIETATGMVLLQCEKGSNFQRPSAEFVNSQNQQGAWVYSEGIDNPEAFPTLQQLQLYCEYRFDQMVYGSDAAEVLETYDVILPKLPATLIEAMDAYFATIHDSMYVIGYLNIIVAEQLAQGTYVNTVPALCAETDTELKLRLTRISEIYHTQVFGDYQPEE